jgi:hypothetical protein
VPGVLKDGTLKTIAAIRTRSFVVAAVIAVALMGVLGAAAASAAPGSDATIHLSSALIQAGQRGPVSVTCPSNSRVMGGGVTADASGSILIEESGPLDDTGTVAGTGDGDIGRSWYAYVVNAGAASAVQVRVFALCSQSSDAVIEADDVLIPDGRSGYGQATCSSGRATGGGVLTTASLTFPPSQYFLQITSPFDPGETNLRDDGDFSDHWWSFIHNASLLGGSQTFKFLALCSQGSDATAEATSMTIPDQSLGAATPACPAGKRTVGGGVATTGPLPQVGPHTGAQTYQLNQSGPRSQAGTHQGTNDGDIGRSWYGEIVNSSGAQQLFKVYAMCQPNPVGYPRPKGATPIRVPLVPAYVQCVSSNSTHGAPLSYPSCAPPAQRSSDLTVGTPDANGKAANFIGSLTIRSIVGNPSTSADEADVRFSGSLTDVRRKSDLEDFTGTLVAQLMIRATDRGTLATTDEPQTITDFSFGVPLSCAATADTTIGSTCSVSTTADALAPGAVSESRRTIWDVRSIQVVSGDTATVFATSGVFVP